jgi:hypothetical protein
MAALNRTMLYFSGTLHHCKEQVQHITHARFVAWAMGLRTRVVTRRTTAPKAGRSSKSRQRWQKWGNVLRKHELQALAAWLLEAASPLALISAQLLYMGSPFLGADAGHLARLLESDEDRLEFADSLRSDSFDLQSPVPGAGQ